MPITKLDLEQPQKGKNTPVQILGINSPDADNHDVIKKLINKLLGALSALEDSTKNQNPNIPPDGSSIYQLRMIQVMWNNADDFIYG